MKIDWHFPRLPDWLVYAVVVLALLVSALSRRERADAPEAPPPPPGGEGALIGPASPFDPAIMAKAPQLANAPTIGTAFSVAEQGVWISARHVLEGCKQVSLLVGPGRGVAAKVRIDPKSEVAILSTVGGAPPLPLGLGQPLRIGERAFHPGFPQGRPGEAASRLLGRETMVTGDRGPRGAGGQPVVAWAESGRTDHLEGSLAGLSGAPALDAAGRVVGMTIAQAPRRGRIYTVPPEAVLAALKNAGVTVPSTAQGEPITVENYGRVADSLRRDLRVAQVMCMKS